MTDAEKQRALELLQNIGICMCLVGFTASPQRSKAYASEAESCYAELRKLIEEA